MRLLLKARGTGKTMGLIYASEATGYPIVTNSKIQVSYIQEQAKSMGCDIPEPITVGELHTSRVLPPETNVLFDNVETILEDALNCYLGVKVVGATMSSPEKKTICKGNLSDGHLNIGCANLYGNNIEDSEVTE